MCHADSVIQPTQKDLPDRLVEKFGNEGREVYEKTRELWQDLPHSVIVQDRYLIVHGGVPTGVSSVEELARAALSVV